MAEDGTTGRPTTRTAVYATARTRKVYGSAFLEALPQTVGSRGNVPVVVMTQADLDPYVTRSLSHDWNQKFAPPSPGKLTGPRFDGVNAYQGAFLDKPENFERLAADLGIESESPAGENLYSMLSENNGGIFTHLYTDSAAEDSHNGDMSIIVLTANPEHFAQHSKLRVLREQSLTAFSRVSNEADSVWTAAHEMRHHVQSTDDELIHRLPQENMAAAERDADGAANTLFPDSAALILRLRGLTIVHSPEDARYATTLSLVEPSLGEAEAVQAMQFLNGQINRQMFRAGQVQPYFLWQSLMQVEESSRANGHEHIADVARVAAMMLEHGHTAPQVSLEAAARYLPDNMRAHFMTEVEENYMRSQALYHMVPAEVASHVAKVLPNLNMTDATQFIGQSTRPVSSPERMLHLTQIAASQYLNAAADLDPKLEPYRVPLAPETSFPVLRANSDPKFVVMDALKVGLSDELTPKPDRPSFRLPPTAKFE